MTGMIRASIPPARGAFGYATEYPGDTIGQAFKDIANGDAVEKGDARIGVKRHIASAAVQTLDDWIESQPFNTSNFAGIVADGVTDNRAALENLIGLLPIGACIKVKGIIRIASTLTITRRINIICEGANDAFLIDVGTANDGVVFSGPAGGLNNIELKLNIYGRADACRDALVLSRVDRSPNIDLNVYAGAVGYGINLKGMLINKIKIQSSVNYLPPITNPAFQAKHVKAEKALGVAFNANELYVNLEGGGSGITGDNMTSEGNNTITGTIEGLLSGRPIDLDGWLGVTVRDLHLEANALGPRFFNCSHVTLGPSVVNADSATPAVFENCRQPFIDGYYGAYTFDLNCSFPRIGRVLAMVPDDLGTDSYFASSEVQGATAWIGSADVFYGGPGSFTLENLFHNPFMDLWSNGYNAAPDGCALSNATCTVSYYPAPSYTSAQGVACEVTVLAGTNTISDGFIATCKPPYNKGQQQGHFMAAMAAIWVPVGQPDVIVFILSSGQFFDIGKVTEKGKWVEVRGGARCSPGGDDVQIRVVPWNFSGGGVLPGKFIVGGLSVVQGVRAPRHLCNHGKREAHVAPSIGNTPAFVGQRALVAGKWYMAAGVASAADWLMLN